MASINQILAILTLFILNIMKTEDLETAPFGFANGISTQLAKHLNDNIHSSLSEFQKRTIIEEAALHYGKFLTALGVDWENDPNSKNTPLRVAKAYVNDLWKGRYNLLDPITTFPSDGYNGIILEKDIPVLTNCSHHHLPIMGKCHIAYIPNMDGTVIGLSKLNRIVEHFSRRGSIQEQLTLAIHNALTKVLYNTIGVMVIIQASHGCVSCRGVRHIGSTMVTSEVSGAFADHQKTAKSEVMAMLNFQMDGYR